LAGHIAGSAVMISNMQESDEFTIMKETTIKARLDLHRQSLDGSLE
jgi:hypothetical protein